MAKVLFLLFVLTAGAFVAATPPACKLCVGAGECCGSSWTAKPPIMQCLLDQNTRLSAANYSNTLLFSYENATNQTQVHNFFFNLDEPGVWPSHNYSIRGLLMVQGGVSYYSGSIQIYKPNKTNTNYWFSLGGYVVCEARPSTIGNVTCSIDTNPGRIVLSLFCQEPWSTACSSSGCGFRYYSAPFRFADVTLCLIDRGSFYAQDFQTAVSPPYTGQIPVSVTCK